MGCLPYLYTWWGPNANLACRSDVLHVVRWKCRTQKIAKNSPSGHHRTTLSGYIFATKAILTIGKKLLNNNISPTCRHNMVNFGPLAAEICWWVWGTPANFNGFRVLASLLHRRRSTKVNQTLHDVWPSHGLIHSGISPAGKLSANGKTTRTHQEMR